MGENARGGADLVYIGRDDFHSGRGRVREGVAGAGRWGAGGIGNGEVEERDDEEKEEGYSRRCERCR